jgi:predicted nucleic acid-binding protein
VSNDRDLLDLQKPFGIAIVTPLELLLEVRRLSEM